MPDIGVNFPEHIIEITPSANVLNDTLPNTLSGVRRAEEREYEVIIALINNNKAIPNRTFLFAANEIEKEDKLLKENQRKRLAYKLISSTIWIPCILLISIIIFGLPIIGVIIILLIFIIPFLIGLYTLVTVILYGVIVALGFERPFPFEVKNLINSYYFSGFNIKNKQNEDSTSLLNSDNCIKITKFREEIFF